MQQSSTTPVSLVKASDTLSDESIRASFRSALLAPASVLNAPAPPFSENEEGQYNVLVFNGSMYGPSWRAALTVEQDRAFMDTGDEDTFERVNDLWDEEIDRLQSSLALGWVVHEDEGMVWVIVADE